MDQILTTLIFLLVIGFLVFIHELGHFVAAKISKINVYEFSIGFGPAIIERKIGGTLYKLSLLPLGGYVQLDGETESSSVNGFRNQPFFIKLFVLSAGVIVNLIFSLIVFAFLLNASNFKSIFPVVTDYKFLAEKSETILPIYISNIGEYTKWENVEDGENLVGFNGNRFEDKSDFLDLFANTELITIEGQGEFFDFNKREFYTKDITLDLESFENDFSLLNIPFRDGRSESQIPEEGIVVTQINGESFESIDEYKELLAKYENTKVVFTYIDFVTGDTKEIELQVFRESENGSRLDVALYEYNGFIYLAGFPEDNQSIYYLEYPKSFISYFTFTIDTSFYQLKALGDLLFGAASTGDFSEVQNNTGSIVQVGAVINDIVETNSFSDLLPFTAFISLSLAIFNILPIPALDGGQIFIYSIESISRRRFSDKVMYRIQFIGFIFVFSLGILLMFSDLSKFGIFDSILNIFKSIFGR